MIKLNRGKVVYFWTSKGRCIGSVGDYDRIKLHDISLEKLQLLYDIATHQVEHGFKYKTTMYNDPENDYIEEWYWLVIDLNGDTFSKPEYKLTIGL